MLWIREKFKEKGTGFVRPVLFGIAAGLTAGTLLYIAAFAVYIYNTQDSFSGGKKHSILAAPGNETEKDVPAFNVNTEVYTPAPLPTPTYTPSPTATQAPAATPTPVPVQTPAPLSTPVPGESQDTKNGDNSNIQPTPAKVEYKTAIRWGDKTKPQLSITFDDGYDAKAVKTVLDVAKRYNFKTTFFVIGTHLSQHPDLWKRAVKEGHQVCNHTQNHKTLTKLSDSGVKDEILTWEKTVKKVLGEEYLTRMKKDFPYVRFPGGAGNSNKRILKLAGDLGYIPMGWSTETYHSILRHYNLKKSNAKAISEKVSDYIINEAGKGSIVLLHFTAYDTLSFDDMVKGVTKKGLAIKPLSEVIEKNVK